MRCGVGRAQRSTASHLRSILISTSIATADRRGNHDFVNLISVASIECGEGEERREAHFGGVNVVGAVLMHISAFNAVILGSSGTSSALNGRGEQRQRFIDRPTALTKIAPCGL